MSSLKTLGIAVLSALLVLSIIGISFLNSITSNFLNEEFYIQEMEKANAFQQAKEIIKTQFSEANIGSTGAILSKEEIVEIVDKSLTEKWMKEQARQLMHELLAYLNSEKQSLELRLDFTEIKPELSNSIMELMQRKMPITVIPGIQEQVQKQVESLIPNYYNLQELGSFEELSKIREVISSLSTALNILAAIAIILAALIALACRKSINSVLKWIGASLLAAGAIIAIAGFLLSEAGKQAAAQVFLQIPKQTSSLAIQLVNNAINAFTTALIQHAVLFIMVGAVMLFAGFFWKPKIKTAGNAKAG